MRAAVAMTVGAIGSASALAVMHKADTSDHKMVVRTKEGLSKIGEVVTGGLSAARRLAAWIFDKTLAVFSVAGEATGAIVVASVAARVVSAVFGIQSPMLFSGIGRFLQRSFGWLRSLLATA